jgi:hypothetical protein
MDQFKAADRGDLQQLRVALTVYNVNATLGITLGLTVWSCRVRQLLYRDGRQCERM